ncbi:unnamed protein product, partial [Allacma fusca]
CSKFYGGTFARSSMGILNFTCDCHILASRRLATFFGLRIECDQCLPGSSLVAYGHGICMCLEGVEEPTSKVVVLRSDNVG